MLACFLPVLATYGTRESSSTYVVQYDNSSMHMHWHMADAYYYSMLEWNDLFPFSLRVVYYLQTVLQ